MKNLYFFGFKNNESLELSKFLLGGKGYGLYQMSKEGISVPPGFVISTKECYLYQKNNQLSNELKKEIETSILKLEIETSKSFYAENDSFVPLLVSVRSGAPVSMPGMMDTVLNVGLNDKTVEILAKKTNNEVFAYDSYRRFIEMYSNVVIGLNPQILESLFKNNFPNKEKNKLKLNDLKSLISLYKNEIKRNKFEFPQDKKIQLFTTVEKIFQSWKNERAVKYREIYNISEDLGTAVIIQSMIFGNLNENSGTGVLFSRDPSNGNKVVTGEYLQKAQGEDIVSGCTTPLKLEEMKNIIPETYKILLKNVEKLEKINKDVQDIEFTVEDSKLWILQTRNAKRTSKAAIKITCDMIKEGLISKEEGIERIDQDNFAELFHKSFATLSKQEESNYPLLSIGLAASTGCASGMIILDSELAETLSKQGKKVILIREETNPEDISGMHNAEGILTARGGMTSHAAVIARGFGKPCVSGCSKLHINYEERKILIKDIEIKENEFISINGSTGEIFKGDKPMSKEGESVEELESILKFSREFKNIDIRINAENTEDFKKGLSFSKDGIGLLRTEHMFFEKKRLLLLRKLIINQNNSSNSEDLKVIFEYHKQDFIEIFKISEGLPLNIRLLDPPLHEFLPISKYEIRKFSKQVGAPYEDLKIKIQDLKEVNPMMGCRGVRVGVVFPELYQMEIKAIFIAYLECLEKYKIDTKLEIMIPLIINEEEIILMKKIILDIKNQIESDYKIKIPCKIGTMIETPAACIEIEKIAKHIDYISFGTNDLTQTALGLSRDDYTKFINKYKTLKLFNKDPFITLNESVKKLIQIAIIGVKKVSKDIYWSMCGEHAGDPTSIDFAIENNFKYISCSPYRIPAAIITVAKNTIKKKNAKEI